MEIKVKNYTLKYYNIGKYKSIYLKNSQNDIIIAKYSMSMDITDYNLYYTIR